MQKRSSGRENDVLVSFNIKSEPGLALAPWVQCPVSPCELSLSITVTPGMSPPVPILNRYDAVVLGLQNCELNNPLSFN